MDEALSRFSDYNFGLKDDTAVGFYRKTLQSFQEQLGCNRTEIVRRLHSHRQSGFDQIHRLNFVETDQSEIPRGVVNNLGSRLYNIVLYRRDPPAHPEDSFRTLFWTGLTSDLV